MEEDIKRLKVLLIHAENTLLDEEAIALEHLIKAYKELEYKYNRALSDLVQESHKNKELEEENRYLKTHIIYPEIIKLNYIPISLVEEKIEEYKKRIEKYYEYKEQRKEADVEFYENITNIEIVQVLQELLEKR